MKSPREILFEKHRDAEAKLKQLDAQHLAAYARESTAANTPVRPRLSSWPGYFWREAILPWRKLWLGVASAWVVIIGASLLLNSQSSRAVVAEAKVDSQTRTALLEQHHMLAQLLEPPSTPLLKPLNPGPRSEVRREETLA